MFRTPRTPVFILSFLGLTLAACNGGAPKLDSESSETALPTWHQDIAAILIPRCSGCHADGKIAPFTLQSYEQVVQYAAVVKNAVQQRSMPPFLARESQECQPPRAWKHDPRLSDEEILKVERWVDNGTPLGDPNTAKPFDLPPPTTLERVDHSIPMGRSIEVNSQKDLFKCISIDPGFTEAKFIKSAQFIPGNANVLHHAIAYIDNKGESKDKGEIYDCFGGPLIENPRILYAWAPGARPLQTPENSGIYVPPGARIILNLHYHPTGRPESDHQTRLELQWTDTEPALLAEAIFVGNTPGPFLEKYGLQPGPNDNGKPEFRIPANAENHSEHMTFPVTDDYEAPIWLMATHLHYVGTRAKIWVERPGVGDICMIDTPDWDFNWQLGYAYEGPIDKLPTVKKGDTIHVKCEYNNSMSNPFVVDALREQGLSAPKDVFLGEETLDEMCLGLIGYLVPNTPETQKGAQSRH